ncbi:helix-turn-helix transcriptional regulator [Alkalicoccobacillus plakortidis]|uniref:YafY family transcriptional regulator n=1 Tax=Alkalicoccobacillus plakortidis TaxID=444060 RepID=A0ABT0XQ97_9BACI|nr:YafY family protein [Alkalicoccobacillus plakortidis]MCM2677414.1 YafY family transcriptional regulator [Alkalicoccobacillus plakortidis]
MQKIERLISIVMILLQKDVVSASEFSRLFDVTKRTIQRDMETLSYANIPIYAKHGHEGGYALMEEYKFDKRLLTHKDIENITVALDGFEQLTTNADIQMTIQKIRGMSHVDVIPKLYLSFYNWVGRNQLHDELSFIIDAIENHWLLDFEYVDQKGNITHRVVEPYKLQLIEMNWYLLGYSLEREAYRTFKLTRITDIGKKGFFTPRPEQEAIKEKDEKRPVVKPTMTNVKLQIDISVRDQFIERYGRQSVVKKTKRIYMVNIKLPENQFAYQFLSGFGNKVKIIEPKGYIDKYVSFFKEALKLYQ